jgi:ABC-type amino acid transport substrate-binding protein
MDSMRKTGPRGMTRGRVRNPLLVALGAFLPVLALLASPPASAGGTLDRVKQSGTLKLGYGPDNPLSKGGSGSPSGFAIDLCNKIADAVKADLGSPDLKVEYVSVTREEGVGAVASGKVDVLCAPLVATAANRKLVSYSIPVFASGVGALVRKDASERLKDILSGRTPANAPYWRGNSDQILRDSTIAVVKGSRAEAAVAKAIEGMQLVPTVVAVDDYATGVMRLQDGRSNVLFGDRVVLLDAVRQKTLPDQLEVLDRYFTYETLAFATPRDDEDLRLIVDSTVSKVFRSSELPGLFVKWFDRPPTDTGLTIFRASTLSE